MIGNKGGNACEAAFYDCNKNIFDKILAIAGDINVREVQFMDLIWVYYLLKKNWVYHNYGDRW